MLLAYIALLIVAMATSYGHHTLNTGDTPRAGEPYVSDEFFSCVGRLLARGRTEPHNASIPLLSIPVTLDYMDLKALMCNITTPVRRMMIVNSGIYRPLRGLLDRLVQFTNYPDGLLVRHHPENVGYATAVNMGFRWALDLGHKRSPLCS